MTLIAAHRGASRRLPDNSAAAFLGAIDSGCEVIETDVRADATGRLVLSHDPVKPGASPLALAELLALAAGRIGLDLELKEAELAEPLVAALDGWSQWLLVTSFDAEAVAAVRGLAPHVQTGLLVEAPEVEDPVALARDCRAGTLLVEDPLATPQLRERCPLPLWVWTVNDTVRLDELLHDPRIGGVITDDPALALARRATR